MPFLNIDASAVVVYTNKLEKLHKSALPVAIRTALNSAAFDVKQNTMPKSADRFIKRQPNFFKANSRVLMAKGFDINDMRSVVGFTTEHLRIPNTNYAILDLEQQEYGGAIQGKSFIPLDQARSGQSYVKPVRPSNRLTEIQDVVNSNNLNVNLVRKGSRMGLGNQLQSKKALFMKAAQKAGPGGHVLGNTGKQILWRIDSVSRGAIKMTPLYSYKHGRAVHVGETGFMRSATLESAGRLEEFYIIEAEKQIERLK